MHKKICKRCDNKRNIDLFREDSSCVDGRRNVCNTCVNDSKFVGRKVITSAKKLTPAQERSQVYNARMGKYADDVTNGNVSKDSDAFITELAQQESRNNQRRTDRSASLLAAQQKLGLDLLKNAVKEHLSSKIVPTGYGAKRSKDTIKRTVVLLLSDLHFGSDLLSLDNPIPYRAIEEARRLEFVTRETIDYKPQYRANTELLLLLNGDLLDGAIHDLNNTATITEQMIVCWKYFQPMMAWFSKTFPKVRVVCTTGNHSRITTYNARRATSAKYNSYETILYYGLKEMCSSLSNVEFFIPFMPVAMVDVYGNKILVSHSDTEIKIGHPDNQAAQNAAILDKINSTELYGSKFEVAAFGHWHTGRVHYKNPRTVFNAALVPPNGHARTMGYIGEASGQMLFECTPDYALGDVRFLSVDKTTDADERLGNIIKPFRFKENNEFIV